MFNTIQRQFNTYTRAIPANMSDLAVKSGIYSLALSTVLSGSIQSGIGSGIVAATASIISGLTLPFFRQHFASFTPNANYQSRSLNWYQYATAQVVNLVLTQILFNTTTGYRVDLISSAVIMVVGTLAIKGFNNYYPTDKNFLYITI